MTRRAHRAGGSTDGNPALIPPPLNPTHLSEAVRYWRAVDIHCPRCDKYAYLAKNRDGHRAMRLYCPECQYAFGPDKRSRSIPPWMTHLLDRIWVHIRETVRKDH